MTAVLIILVVASKNPDATNNNNMLRIPNARNSRLHGGRNAAFYHAFQTIELYRGMNGGYSIASSPAAARLGLSWPPPFHHRPVFSPRQPTLSSPRSPQPQGRKQT
ncbi:hypothetical protein ASPWEDRAFT_203938 [Aspergillus wentii DTO 134E9]|uniref:Uncharacterized protein n=1 Tax=Aspergillus wentii DTO 134E9 TaxID=1073089 RepID=A0A1L9RZI4_ASPWE|nr:uncharacterized protein ASPWEDRAFT_203938 [Aspergillus wentii DTO 134E9]OJJ40349.1 hypothetical protein ASPWEDRAFT_203938 [Aspergillus wentii DTO 134E9]